MYKHLILSKYVMDKRLKGILVYDWITKRFFLHQVLGPNILSFFVTPVRSLWVTFSSERISKNKSEENWSSSLSWY